jgi:DNA-binding beta-propeller fold protein YncE
MRRLGAILCLVLTLFAAVPERAAADSIDRIWMVGDEPAGIVIDPTDGRVYVANSKISPADGASIYVVDPSRAPGSPGESRRLTTSGPPAILALDPLHRRLYSSNQDRTLQVFDLTTMSLEATLPVGGLGVVVDPSTRRVYVVDVVGSTFSIVAIDGATNTILQTQSALPREFWWGLAIDPALHRLYVTNIDTTLRNLVVLDTRDLTRVDALTLPIVPRFALAVDEALHRVYVAGHDPNGLGFGPTMLYALDGSTLATLDSVQVSGFPGGIALAPATHRIYVTNNCPCPSEPWGYSEVDDLTFGLVRFHATPRPPFLAAMHPDGRLYLGAWNSSGADELVAISLGNTPPVITSLASTPSAPRTNDTLRAEASAIDPDFPEAPGAGQAVTLTYEWLRNGVVVPGEAGSTLDLSTVGDRGDTITARVTASDGELSTIATTFVVVANTPLMTSTVSLSDATPGTHDLLVATAQSDDADNDATYTYTWSVNGEITRVASTVGSDSFDLRIKGNGDNGDVITVAVVASDGASNTPQVSASATVTPGRRK